MRRLLGPLVLALSLGLGACGEESPSDADSTGNESPTGTESPTISDSPSDTGAPEVATEVLRIVSQTAAGGEIANTAIRIDQPAGMARLAREFSTPAFATKIRRVVERNDVATGQALYGQVIAIGCDVPPSAAVTVVNGKVVITAGKVVNPMPECFAPVTSVAIARVDLPLG